MPKTGSMVPPGVHEDAEDKRKDLRALSSMHHGTEQTNKVREDPVVNHGLENFTRQRSNLGRG